MAAKATAAPSIGREGVASDGVFVFGMFARDDPVTWEIHAFPRERRSNGEPVTSPRRGSAGPRTADAAAVRERAPQPSGPFTVGRRPGKTGAEADEGEEVGMVGNHGGNT